MSHQLPCCQPSLLCGCMWYTPFYGPTCHVQAATLWLLADLDIPCPSKCSQQHERPAVHQSMAKQVRNRCTACALIIASLTQRARRGVHEPVYCLCRRPTGAAQTRGKTCGRLSTPSAAPTWNWTTCRSRSRQQILRDDKLCLYSCPRRAGRPALATESLICRPVGSF